MPAPLDLAALVLVTIATVGVVLMAAVPALSRRYGGLVVVVLAAGAVLAVVTERLPAVAATAMVAVTAAFWLVDRGIPANRRRPAWVVVLAVVMVIVGVGCAAAMLLVPPDVP